MRFPAVMAGHGIHTGPVSTFAAVRRVFRAGIVGSSAVLLIASCGGDSVSADDPLVEDGNTSTSEASPSTWVSTSTSAVSATAEIGIEPDFTEVSATIERYVAENGLNGAGLVIVDRDDGVIHQESVGEFTNDRISLIASSSKMVTAGVLMKLHEGGLLDIDAPVNDLVDWQGGPADITPAQLVSNSSGLVGLGPQPAYGPYICQFIAAGSIQECGETIFTTPDDDLDVIPPDTEFRYGGGQWQVAGAVAEIASGKSWAELIDEVYVEPCGLESFGYNNHFAQISSEDGPFSYPEAFNSDPATLMPTENPNMEAGVYTTTGDYGALLLMHLRGGLCDDNRVLSEESVARLHEDRTALAYQDAVAEVSPGYGMGWWVDRGKPGVISDGGAFGASPWIDTERGYGAYLAIEATNELGSALAEQIRPLIEEQVGAVAG